MMSSYLIRRVKPHNSTTTTFNYIIIFCTSLMRLYPRYPPRITLLLFLFWYTSVVQNVPSLNIWEGVEARRLVTPSHISITICYGVLQAPNKHMVSVLSACPTRYSCTKNPITDSLHSNNRTITTTTYAIKA